MFKDEAQQQLVFGAYSINTQNDSVEMIDIRADQRLIGVQCKVTTKSGCAPIQGLAFILASTDPMP